MHIGLLNVNNPLLRLSSQVKKKIFVKAEKKMKNELVGPALYNSLMPRYLFDVLETAEMLSDYNNFLRFLLILKYCGPYSL